MAITIMLALMHAIGAWQMPAWRDHAAFSVMALAALFATGGCMVWLWYRECGRAMIPVAITLALFAYAVEALGIHTGFPYGAFSYQPGALGPSAWGVPIALPFAWMPLVLGVVALTHGTARRVRLPIAVLALVLVDAVLDPAAVKLSLWSYAHNVGWFGVPWTNYLGWCVSGAVGAWLVHRSAPTDSSGWMRKLFACTLMFWAFAAFRLGLWVPGAIGMVFGAYALYQGIAAIKH